MELSKIAVTHASSLFAEALLQQLSESGIQPDSVVLLDAEEQAGNRLAYADTYITVLDQYDYDYENLLAVLFLEQDEELQGLLQHADCFVFGHHLVGMDDKPLFVTDVSDRPDQLKQPGMIRLPSAQQSTLLKIIKPLHDWYGIQNLSVVNIESAAIYGKAAVDELASQTINLLNSRDIQSKLFPLQLAFNMIPCVSENDHSISLPELLGMEDLKCSVQSMVVASFYGMAIAVTLELDKDIELKELEGQINTLPGVQLKTDSVSPLTHCKTGSEILINGLQQPQNETNRLQFWIIADSVRNGLIQNYQNILEILLKSYL